MSKSENIALYKYLTRPARPQQQDASVERQMYAEAGSVKQSHRYDQAFSNPEQIKRIKQLFSEQLPKNINFDFKTFPRTGVPYYGETKKLANRIRTQLDRPGSTLNLGEDARSLAFKKTKNNLVDLIEEEIKDFEETKKVFPNEKYVLNKREIVDKYKRRYGRGVDYTTVKNLYDEVYKDSNRITEQAIGTNTASQLTNKETDFFNKNYSKKSISQMARELSNAPYDSNEFKSLRSRLMRRRDTLIREGILTEADFEQARAAKRKTIKEQKIALKGGGFQKYRDAQQRLMDLDPKNFEKYSNPSTLDSELKRLINYRNVGLATRTLPSDFLASFEHFQGITPGHITQDPSALRKTGIVGRKYNWKLMGRQGKYSPYLTVKENLRTARAELKQGDLKAAKESLKKVNIVYDEVQDSLGTVKRNELPKYTIKGDQIIETNLKGVMKPQTLQKSFDQYFRNIAGYATEKNIQQIKKTQPNVAEALDLYRSGNDKAAKELIKQRIPEITTTTKLGTTAIKPGPAGLFAEAIPGSRYASEFLQGFADDVMSKSYGKAALKGLGLAGAAYGVYDTGVALKEGKSIPETAARFFALDVPYQKLRQYNRLTDEEQEIQKRVNQQRSFDAASQDILDEGLVTMRPRPEIAEEDLIKLEQGKQRVDAAVEAEESERAASRKGLVETVKQKIYEVTGTPYELYMNRGGRVQLSEGGKPKDLGRRKFIKGAVTIAAALPFLKFIKPLSKTVEPTIEAISRSANQMPDYLTNLINKVKMMGESKIIGKMDSPDEFMRYDLGDYELYEGVGGARLKRIRDRGDYGYEEFEMQIKQDPETGYIEYEEVSARPDGDGKIKDFDFGIEDDVHAEMKKFADEK